MHGPCTVPAQKPKVLVDTTATSGTIDSGTIFTEANGFSSIGFQMVPHTAGTTPSGYSAQVYGTMDPAAMNADRTPNTNYPAPSAAGGAWFPLPASSSQNAAPDTSNYANPLTTITTPLYYRGPALVAIRVVITATAATNGCTILGWAWD